MGAAGNWVLNRTIRERETYWQHKITGAVVPYEDIDNLNDYQSVRFGGFPFLGYAPRENGFAMHGPINRTNEEWFLKRGQVSHGCNRMAGEHVVELSVLAGCAKFPKDGKNPNGEIDLCPDPDPNTTLDDQLVTVIEEFDIVPRYKNQLGEGVVRDWDLVEDYFLALDVDYERGDASKRRYNGYVAGKADNGRDIVELRHTDAIRFPRRDGNAPRVQMIKMKTWDNQVHRVNEVPLVEGRNIDNPELICE